MTRPIASPKVAAATRRAGARLLEACRKGGTPNLEHSDEWPFEEAAGIAKHVRPGDALIAQVAYLMLVRAMAVDLQSGGVTYASALRLERALAEFIEGHGFAYRNGKIVDEHAAFVALQQQEQVRRGAKLAKHRSMMFHLEASVIDRDPELKAILEPKPVRAVARG
jgi:hypothetical protein